MSVDRLVKTVEGREALSDFRRRRLLAKLKACSVLRHDAFAFISHRYIALRYNIQLPLSTLQTLNAATESVTAHYVHYVELKSALDETENKILKEMLTYGPRPTQQDVCWVRTLCF